MAFGTTPLSTTTIGNNQFPVSAVAVPGETGGNLTALEGGPESTDSNGNKTAPASTYTKDGGNVALGTSTDANTVNSVMGRLTKIRDLLSATLTVAVSGNVTEANSAAIKADLDAINTAIGAVSDAAWSGSGNGSEIAILKKIEAVLAATLTVAGTVSVSNFPGTQPVSGTVSVNALPAGSNTIGGVELVDSGGTNKASISAGGALKVDNSAVTQPVSGSVSVSNFPGTQAVSGTVTANAGSGTFNNQQTNVTADYDSGAGTQNMTMYGVALPASGGAVAGGTASNPLRTDPTGTTTQPVSGSVTATIQSNASVNVNQVAGSAVGTAAAGIMKVGLTDGSGTAITSTSNAIDVNIKSGGGSGFSVTDEAAWTAGTSAMVPTGGVFNDSAAALTSGQEGTVRVTNNRALHANLRDASGNQLLGSKTSANSVPVVVASDQGAVPVSGTFWQATQPVSGTVTANAGSGTFNNQQSNNTADYDTGAGTQTMTMWGLALPASGGSVAGGTASNPVRTDPTGTTTQPVSGTVTANQGGSNWSTNTVQLNGTTVDTNSGVKSAGTQRVVLATDQPALTNALKVDGSGVTQPVSGTVSVNALPAGSNTIGGVELIDSAGTNKASISAGGALKVDNSAVTQPVSGTVTANQGGAPWSDNITQIAGTSIATAASGVQKVGIVGNAGATVDSTVAAGSAPTNAVVTGVVYNSSAPTPTSGQAMAVQADQAGNLRMAQGIALAALSAWSSATSLNATQTIFTNSGVPAVLVQVDQTTTITAGAITFEVTYDGTNWVTATANCVLDPTSTTYAQISLPYTLQANTNKPFIVTNNGWQGLRIKLSTQITGSGTVTPNYALLAYDPVDSAVVYSPTAANFQVTVGAALPAGSNTIGAVTQASGPWTTQPQAIASGGATTYHLVSASGTNATNVKNGAGTLYGFSITNTNASARYVHFYNKASAPTVGTDTPVATVGIPGSGVVIRAFPVGANYGTGISFGTSTGAGDTDSGSVGAGDLVVDLEYK